MALLHDGLTLEEMAGSSDVTDARFCVLAVSDVPAGIFCVLSAYINPLMKCLQMSRMFRGHSYYLRLHRRRAGSTPPSELAKGGVPAVIISPVLADTTVLPGGYSQRQVAVRVVRLAHRQRHSLLLASHCPTATDLAHQSVSHRTLTSGPASRSPVT